MEITQSELRSRVEEPGWVELTTEEKTDYWFIGGEIIYSNYTQNWWYVDGSTDNVIQLSQLGRKGTVMYSLYKIRMRTNVEYRVWRHVMKVAEYKQEPENQKGASSMNTCQIAVVKEEKTDGGSFKRSMVAGPETIICDSVEQALVQAALKWPEECQAEANGVAVYGPFAWSIIRA